MSRFNNLKLAHRLGISFGVLIVALATVAAIGLSALGGLNRHVVNLSERDVVRSSTSWPSASASRPART